MWIALSDSFLSIVKKDCKPGELLVRARREGDIEKVFGKTVKVTRTTDSDYLYRAVVSQLEVLRALGNEVRGIRYPNFKDSVKDHALHMAYLQVWHAMADLQKPPPYSGFVQPRRKIK